MHYGEKSGCWQGPHQMAWRAGWRPAGRLLHTPALNGLTIMQFVCAK